MREKINTINITDMSVEDTKRLNEISERYRKPYTELVGKLSECEDDYWWYTAFSSRNTSIDSCFYECCCLRLIYERIKEDFLNVITVPTDSLGRAVKANLSILSKEGQNKIEVKCRKRRGVGRRSFVRGSWILHAADAMLSCRRIRKIYQPADSKKIAGNEVTLVTTFVEGAAFSKEGFKDRYFPGLKENADDLIVFFLSVSGNKKEQEYIANELSKMEGYIPYEAYVEKEDFFNIISFIKWSRSYTMSNVIFGGMDITPIILHSIRNCTSIETIINGMLKVEAIKRFTNRYGIRLKAVIDWYEGQPSSNILFASKRDIGKDTVFVAYEASPLGENYISQYPGIYQIENGKGADFYTVQGNGWTEKTKQFCQNIYVIEAPSFRYKDAVQQSADLVDTWGADKNLLVILSYFVEDSKKMLETVFRTKVARRFEKVYIKNHPNNLNMRLKDYGISDSDIIGVNYEFVSGLMKDALRLASNVLIGQTTSAIEILLGGGNIVFFGFCGKLINYFLPDGVPMMETVYDEKDIDECFEKERYCLNTKDKEKLRELSFIAVNKKTVKDFLDIGEN